MVEVRIESSVISLSWIPSEAIGGIMRAPFDIGPMHYDDPPPDRIDDLEGLARAGMGRTKLGFGSRKILYPTIRMPDLQPAPEVGPRSVRFVQTTGGRPALPLPRKLNRPPFVQIMPPVVWTTLALTINADGSTKREVLGASPFPRHWVYDGDGKLESKVAVTDFGSWSG